VAELRYALTQLGDQMDENHVDDMIKEIDKDNTGVVPIIDFAKQTLGIKEEKKGEKKDAKKDGKKDGKGKGKKK